MKKNVATKKTTAKKIIKRTTPSRSTSGTQTLLFRRIVIISACVVLAIGAFATINKGSVSRSVAGVSIMRGLFMQAAVSLPQISDATSYNIYYRQLGEQSFTNAVRNVSPKVNTYTISYLKQGVSYEYQISAVDKTGKEFYFSPVQPLTMLQSM